jgi:hypothetical protein
MKKGEFGLGLKELENDYHIPCPMNFISQKENFSFLKKCRQKN